MGYVDTLSELEDFEDGSKPWADFVFDLVSIDVRKKLFGGAIEHIAFEMRGSHADGDVGLKVALSPPDWTHQPDDDFPTYWGKVTLASSGENSDRLARLYESWWGLPPDTAKAAPSITVLAVGLASDPREAETQTIRTKMFFDPERAWDGEDIDPVYSELYLNFDLSARRGWLKEKDEGYRRQVVGWLTGRLGKGSP